jgi:hypothetical protein
MEENPSTADRWRKALYELEFRDFHLPLYAPTEVVKNMQRFSDSTSGKAMEVEIHRCRTIIRAWSESLEDVENDFSLSPDFRNEYKSIINWYRSVENEHT